MSAERQAKLDQDASGGLTFEELRSGVREGFGLSQIHMTSEDFDVVTDNGRLLNSRREFNAQQFQHMMKGELSLVACVCAHLLVREMRSLRKKGYIGTPILG